MCKYCKEDDKSKIRNVVVTFNYENPKAYGYPEIVYWSEAYNINYCPICKRIINSVREDKI